MGSDVFRSISIKTWLSDKNVLTDKEYFNKLVKNVQNGKI